MQSNRPEMAIISNHVGRIAQNAGMLSGLKLVYICLKIMQTVSISDERKTAQLHTIKMPVTIMQTALVIHVSGILTSQCRMLLCITNAIPCNSPHKANMILLPCQMPTNRKVMRQWIPVLIFPFLLPPNGM